LNALTLDTAGSNEKKLSVIKSMEEKKSSVIKSTEEKKLSVIKSMEGLVMTGAMSLLYSTLVHLERQSLFRHSIET